MQPVKEINNVPQSRLESSLFQSFYYGRHAADITFKSMQSINQKSSRGQIVFSRKTQSVRLQVVRVPIAV